MLDAQRTPTANTTIVTILYGKAKGDTKTVYGHVNSC